MDGREQMQGQEQAEGQAKHSYEDAIWCNVHDWQVTPRENHETGQTFYDIKLASGTTIQHEGQTLDVGRYHLTTNLEPAVTFGEPGDPKAMRGIIFPQDWDITLTKVENFAKEGHSPLFEVTDRIEHVSPKELAEGITERNNQWRSAHRKPTHEQEAGKDAQDQAQPGRNMTHKPSRQAEPSL